MLIPGIKLGPKDWKEKLDQSDAKYAEIWYRIDWADKYQEMIGELHKRGAEFGFHFWGATSLGYEANLAYPGPNQLESKTQIKNCIDQAAQAKARYVNIHAGNYGLMVMDFEHESLYPDTNHPLVDQQESALIRNTALLELGKHSHNAGVALLVEAIPARVANGKWWDIDARNNPLEEYPSPLTGIVELCKSGLIGFTNDFCHTLSRNLADQSFTDAHKDFLKTTKLFAPYTKVVHVNTLTKPYNGTDAHGGILQKDFNDPSVFPTKQEFLDLFKLLDDAWLIGEPKDNHVENYLALKQLLDNQLITK